MAIHRLKTDVAHIEHVIETFYVPNSEGENDRFEFGPGWYYRADDDEAVGPFATEADAIADASHD